MGMPPGEPFLSQRVTDFDSYPPPLTRAPVLLDFPFLEDLLWEAA